jgi:hypothetical protein
LFLAGREQNFLQPQALPPLQSRQALPQLRSQWLPVVVAGVAQAHNPALAAVVVVVALQLNGLRGLLREAL